MIDVSDVPVENHSAAVAVSESQSPRAIRAVYTGMVPLVYKTQRQLLISLNESIMWATFLIAIVLTFVLKSPIAAAISMIPNMFPIVIIFGALGWLNIKVDIGIMMTASVALGVAVDDTIHFLTWFRRGIAMGRNRLESVMLAYDRCATAMMQTTLIGGLGLAVFATSTFTPTQQFGYLMISMLGAALIGDLLMLPAMLVSPLGHFFSTGAKVAVPEAPSLERHRPEVLEPVVLPEREVVASDEEKDLVAAAAESSASVDQDQQELLEGPHAALHAKLRSLRRELPQDPVSS